MQKDLSDEEYLSKVADRIRNSPIDVTGIGTAMNPFFGFFINPFKGAVAIYVDAGGVMAGGEKDVGVVFILVGKDKGQAVPYGESAGGGASEWGGGFEIGRIDYTGEPSKFTKDMIYGKRTKAWFSVGKGLSAGGGVAWTKDPYFKKLLTSTSISGGLSLDLELLPFGFGVNKGEVRKLKK